MADDYKVNLGSETPPASETEKSAEQEVLEQAVESGDIAPEAAGVEDKDGVIKVNLDKPIEDAVQERETEKVSVGEGASDSEKVDEEVREQSSDEEVPTGQSDDGPEDEQSPIEIIEDDEEDLSESTEKLEKQVEEDDADDVEDSTNLELPENVEKLVSFMNETGGTVEDWVSLNKNIDDADPVSLLRDYYSKTKPHLSQDEVSYLLNRDFYYDQDVDSELEIKEKQIAFKEALYGAKDFLKNEKEQYYADLKLGKHQKIDPEYKEAYDYYKDSKQQVEANKKLAKQFKKKTEKLFGEEFKGFDFKLGDKKVRYKINNVDKVKEYNSDLNNFVGEFTGEDGTISDIKGYHRALYAAKNIDTIANHFYEQGRADAVRQEAKEAKNIDMTPRNSAGEVVTSSGSKFKVVGGDDSSKLRFKMGKYK